LYPRGQGTDTRRSEIDSSEFSAPKFEATGK
jgi:hypothetical protein